jgi:hypothetical protein
MSTIIKTEKSAATPRRHAAPVKSGTEKNVWMKSRKRRLTGFAYELFIFFTDGTHEGSSR